LAQLVYCHRKFSFNEGKSNMIGFLLVIVCQVPLLFIPFPESIAILVSLSIGLLSLFLFRLLSVGTLLELGKMGRVNTGE